jgi:Xaa-Pro aminopeptidase
MRPASAVQYAARLAAVRGVLAEHRLDALVITHAPNLRYLTGFAGSAGALVVLATGVVLIVDFRYLTSARALVRSHPELASVQIALAEGTFEDAIVGVLKEAGAARSGIESVWMSVSRFNKLSAALAAAAPTPLHTWAPCPVLVPLERAVESVRAIKDDSEIFVLREAGRRLSTAAAELRDFLREGRTEAEVAADIDAAVRRAGFERAAFETIVASGPNSALPHARPGARRLQAGDGVVLDFGGVYDGYCVDLTRTVQLAPRSSSFRRLFAAVLEAHDAAIRAVRPGTLASEVDAAARQVLGDHGLAESFGHGTGHGLGLEIHEEPRISRALSGQPDARLAPGMVFTIEPGAYVPGIGGVRIEDDVLVVDGGCELLTHVPIEM